MTFGGGWSNRTYRRNWSHRSHWNPGPTGVNVANIVGGAVRDNSSGVINSNVSGLNAGDAIGPRVRFTQGQT
ncbi:hypothetical protein EDD57_11241 [Baia soyae]|uniref:Uncharacterized protein n=1 Tax=Baia soyae TaxID=1544746 RepID=A0A4V2SY87_9BACL|nr:hypothetical protein EDD57_11241 [Baia soyae]